MPRRLRRSKRRSAATIDPFFVTIGPSPRHILAAFPEEDDQERYQRAWNRWDRSLEGIAFRAKADLISDADRWRLINIVCAPSRPLSARSRPDEVEGLYAENAEAIGELLASVEPKPPPALPA
jgi:hypothetical protein